MLVVLLGMLDDELMSVLVPGVVLPAVPAPMEVPLPSTVRVAFISFRGRVAERRGRAGA